MSGDIALLPKDRLLQALKDLDGEFDHTASEKRSFAIARAFFLLAPVLFIALAWQTEFPPGNFNDLVVQLLVLLSIWMAFKLRGGKLEKARFENGRLSFADYAGNVGDSFPLEHITDIAGVVNHRGGVRIELVVLNGIHSFEVNDNLKAAIFEACGSDK